MSQDYKLKKLYESLLKGEKVAKKETERPRTLAEAYQQKLISERTVFFAKDDDKYTTLGIVEDPQEASHIKNSIKAYSNITTSKNLLENAGWPEDNVLVRPQQLGRAILNHKVESADVSQIANKETKSKLTALEEKIKQAEKFNLFEVVYQGIKNVITDLQTEYTNFKSLFKELAEKESGPKRIGPGELMITLFTNAVKPPNKGDLQFPNSIVEIKKGTMGARLGYVDHGVNYLPRLIVDIVQQKKVSPSKYKNILKTELRQLIQTIKQNSNLAANQQSIFNENFYKQVEKLNKFIEDVDAPGFLEFVNANFNLNLSEKFPIGGRALQQLFDSWKTKKYLNTELTVDPRFDSIEKVFAENLKVFYRVLKTDIYTSKTTSDNPRNIKLTQLSSKTQQAFDTNRKLNSLFTNFFLSGVDYSTDEKTQAEIFTDVLFEARPENSSNPNLKQSIYDALVNNNYLKRLMQGYDLQALTALVFAIHISEYAREDNFDYVLLTNFDSFNALSIPAKNFNSLLDFYEKNKNSFGFRIDFDSNQQGAHHISIK